jgi:hypothetical protein
MLIDSKSQDAPAAVKIHATAFRDDRSAELVTITDLSFDCCQLSSTETFEVGERLRLHLHGQGWIETRVRWTNGTRAGVTFSYALQCLAHLGCLHPVCNSSINVG